MSDIKTTCLSLKLLHCRLGPFEIESQVGPPAYCLKLPHGMRQLHLVFNIVKLSATLEDPILGRKLQAPLPPIVIDREEEWEVEEILDSRWHRRRFQFLVKWKSFSREHNSWEVASNVKALDLVVEYYWKHPAAPRHICQTDFDAIFNPRTIASRCSNLGGGVNIRGPLLSQGLDDLGTTRGECLGRTRWSSPLNWTTYLYYFYKWLYTTSPRSHVLLEYSTIT